MPPNQRVESLLPVRPFARVRVLHWSWTGCTRVPGPLSAGDGAGVKVVLVLLGVALAGCSGNQGTYPAGGKVVFPDGNPLTAGWVSFRPLDSESKVTARGQVQPDGTFDLTTFRPGDGAVAGRHQALVVAPLYDAREGYELPTPPRPFDRRFSNFETSGLEFTVSTDRRQNWFEVVVEPPGRALR